MVAGNVSSGISAVYKANRTVNICLLRQECSI
jgi:hypothetical protein